MGKIKTVTFVLFLSALLFAADNPYTVKTRFNVGEMSPMLHGRFDLNKYNGGCETLQNMIVLPYGGATKRPGTYYVASTKDNNEAILIPFIYSNTYAYVIEAGNQFFRFFYDSAPIYSSGTTPYEIETPYTTSMLDDLTWVQSANVMYFFHPALNTYKLTRTSTATFSLAEVDWTHMPYEDENIEDISMSVQFVQRTLSGLSYDDDGGAQADYKLTGPTNTFIHIIVGDIIRITNSGTGKHLTPGTYTVGTIDSTNYSYICLTTDPSDNSDDTNVQIELVRYDDVTMPDEHQTGVDYEFGDACYIAGTGDTNDRLYLTCITDHTSDSSNAPAEDNFDTGATLASAPGVSNGVWYCYMSFDASGGNRYFDNYIERGMGVVLHSAYSNTISGTPTERDYFDSSWIGSRVKLKNFRESDSILETTVDTGNTLSMGPIRVKGKWWVITNNLWIGTIRVQRSEDYGYTWETVDSYYHEEESNSNFQGSGTENADDIFYRIISDDDGDGTLDNITGTQLDIQFKTDASIQPGVVEITGVASQPSLYNPLMEAGAEGPYYASLPFIWYSNTRGAPINTNLYSGDSGGSERTGAMTGQVAIEHRYLAYMIGAGSDNVNYASQIHDPLLNCSSSGGYSIALWLYMADNSKVCDMVCKGSFDAVPKVTEYCLRVQSAKIKVYHCDKEGTSKICEYDTDAAQVVSNTWVHIVATFNPSLADGARHKIYINGSEVAGTYVTGASYDTSVLPNSTGTGDLWLCKHPTLTPFSGFMREIMIFDTALTTDDITSIYNSGIIPSGNNAYDNLDDFDNLLSLWKMDVMHSSPIIHNERSGTKLIIEDADGDEVDLDNVADVDDFKYGTASYNLQGANYLNMDALASSLLTNQSFTGWFKIDTALTGTNEYCLISRQASNEAVRYELKLDLSGSNHILKLVYSGGTSSGSTVIEEDTWTHVALVNNETNIVVYLNGTAEITYAAGALGSAATDTLRLGALVSSGDAADIFYGHLDDWAVYSSELDSTAISNTYDDTPVAYGIVRHPVFDADGTDVSTDGKSDYTLRWAESSWSPRQGYGEHGTFYDQRLAVGKGTRVWLSVTDDYENFRAGPNDDESLDFTIVSRQPDPIQWLVGQNRLLIGTSGGEWVMGGAGADEPITPTNVFCRQQSTYGSAEFEAIRVNDLILFVQRQARKVREFSYQYEYDKWSAPDLTILSEHITESGLDEGGFQQQKQAILWFNRVDGDVCAMTYEKEQEVIGWHHHTFDGDVESLCVIPRQTIDDQVWMIVERTINGSTVRYIEYMKPLEYDSTSDADLFFVDSGLTTSVTASNTISGLSWLEGENVAVIADGTVLCDGDGSDSNFTVTSGAITIGTATPTYSVVHVGLPYTSVIETMPLSVGADTAIAMRQKRISEVIYNYYNSGDFYAGKSASTAKLIAMTDNETGQERETFTPGFDRNAQIYIYSDSPEPLTMLSLGIEFEFQ